MIFPKLRKGRHGGQRNKMYNLMLLKAKNGTDTNYLSPENSSYNVATDSKITITFDSEMDAESVQSAIAVEPIIAATYTWSTDKKTLTMTPAPGLMANTDYTVTVYDTAKSAAGEQLDGDDDGDSGGRYGGLCGCC